MIKCQTQMAATTDGTELPPTVSAAEFLEQVADIVTDKNLYVSPPLPAPGCL